MTYDAGARNLIAGVKSGQRGRCTPYQFSGGTLTAQVQAALDSSAGEVFLPPDTTWDLGALTLRANKMLCGTKGTILRPNANDITLLGSSGSSSSTIQGVGLSDFTIDMNGKTGVTGISLPGTRHNVSVERLLLTDTTIPSTAAQPPTGIDTRGTVGLLLPTLTWNDKISNIECRALTTGIRLQQASACLLISNCTMIACNTGFDIDGTDKTIDWVTEIRLLGPTVVQQCNTGVKTRSTTRTWIDGFHFESCNIDIDADGDDNLVVNYTAHRGNNSLLTNSTGIKLRNTIGTLIRYPAMYGTRQFGFFDVDTTNTDARLYAQVRGNAPLLNSSFMSYPGVTTGLCCMQEEGAFYDTSTNPDAYRFAATQTRTLPSGVVTISPQHYVNGQIIRMRLRLGSTWTASGSTVAIGGLALDMTNAAALKVNVVEVLRDRTLGGVGYALVSATGWVASS